MSVERWGFELGSDGEVLGSSNANADYVVFTGGTGVISTTRAMHGTRSALLTGNSTSGGMYIYKTFAATSTLGADTYIYITAAPSSELTLLWMGDGSTRGISLGIADTMALRIRNGAGGGGASVWTSSTTLSLNTWYRISLVASPGTTTGTVRAAYYAGDATTPIADSGLLTNQNTGAEPYTAIRLGVKANTTTFTMTANFDDWAYDTEAVALLPPYGTAQPTLGTPTVEYDMAYINMSSTTFTVGPGSYSAVPSSGTYGANSGVVVPRDMNGGTITYVVTATDQGTGSAISTSVDVEGVSPFVRGHSESRVWDGSNWS